MSKFTDRLQKQMNRNNSGVDVAKVLKTKNGKSRTKFSLGDPVTVNKDGEQIKCEIVKTDRQSYFYLMENSYLCEDEHGAREYIKAENIILNWNEKENKPQPLNIFGEVQDNLSNGEIIRLI